MRRVEVAGGGEGRGGGGGGGETDPKTSPEIRPGESLSVRARQKTASWLVQGGQPMAGAGGERYRRPKTVD